VPKFTLRYIREDKVMREEPFRATTPDRALQTVQTRLVAARPGEVLVLLADGVETHRFGPRSAR